MGLFDFLGGGGGGGGSSIQSMWGGAPSLGQTAFNIFQNQQASHQADHAMDRSEEMAQQEMGFQKDMSNTAYQRATKDMTAAGINPMVAFQQGGASSPSGAMGQGFQAPVRNILEGTMSTAMDWLKTKKELDMQGSQEALNQANAANAIAQAGAAGSSAKMTDTNREALESKLTAIKKQADVDAMRADWDKKAVGYDAVMSRANRDAGTANKVFDLFKPGMGMKDPNNWQSIPRGGSVFNPGTGEIVQP